jgi:hypothetical protein
VYAKRSRATRREGYEAKKKSMNVNDKANRMSGGLFSPAAH